MKIGETDLSLIKDVTEELSGLDQSTKKIRQFSALMLLIFGALGYYAFRHHQDWLTSLSALLLLFFLSGFRCSGSVRFVHKYWMGLAVTMGWFVSRLLLTLVYFLIVTPIGLGARMLGKSFLDMTFPAKRESCWIERDGRKHDYGKMS